LPLLDRYESLEETVKVLDRSSRDLVQELEFTNQEQLNAANDAIAQWEARCEELTHKIEEIGEQSSAVVNQWKGMPRLVQKLFKCKSIRVYVELNTVFCVCTSLEMQSAANF
jgi:DNA repair exonuclease SbcCD ATPase subunit